MPYAATMGTASCATISIGWFKKYGKGANEEYKADPSWFTPGEGMTVPEFYTKIIYPTSQPLGRTMDMPFERLMTEIDNSSLSTKLIMATLNHSQYMADDRYWHHELKDKGFKLITKTKNSIGSVNYVYMRNPNEKAIEEGEE